MREIVQQEKINNIATHQMVEELPVYEPPQLQGMQPSELLVGFEGAEAPPDYGAEAPPPIPMEEAKPGELDHVYSEAKEIGFAVCSKISSNRFSRKNFRYSEETDYYILEFSTQADHDSVLTQLEKRFPHGIGGNYESMGPFMIVVQREALCYLGQFVPEIKTFIRSGGVPELREFAAPAVRPFPHDMGRACSEGKEEVFFPECSDISHDMQTVGRCILTFSRPVDCNSALARLEMLAGITEYEKLVLDERDPGVHISITEYMLALLQDIPSVRAKTEDLMAREPSAALKSMLAEAVSAYKRQCQGGIQIEMFRKPREMFHSPDRMRQADDLMKQADALLTVRTVDHLRELVGTIERSPRSPLLRCLHDAGVTAELARLAANPEPAALRRW